MTLVEDASSSPASRHKPLKARDAPELSRGTEVGGLRVEELVDAGGQGTVYRAREPGSGRLYALKFIPLWRAKGWAQREFAIALRLRHPNLVEMMGFGYWPYVLPEFLWLKMVYVQGRPLDRWVWEENADARALTQKLLGVARGLAVAHDVGVMHRDIKEANILVREEDGEAVLVDFGAAWCAGQPTLTQGLYPPGTPHYRSPEAWRFGLENERTPGAHYRPGVADDLYALGVVLYRLLTCRYPFEVEDAESVKAVTTKVPLPPRLVNPRVPWALSELCLKLLAKKPEERPPGAAALCQELEELLSREESSWRVPLQEAPRSTGRLRVWLAVSRRRLRQAAWVGLPLVLGLGGARLGAQWGHESQRAPGPPVATLPAPLPTQAAASGREVAPPWRPLEAGDMPLKDETPVKQQKRSSSLKKWCVGATAAVSTACPGAQVHPASPPLPEECPPGAVEAMRGLRIFPTGPQKAVFFIDYDLNPMWITRPAGSVTVTMRGTGNVPTGSMLSGRIFFWEDRVYGRFTQVRLPTGETYPVCMEINMDGKRGARLKAHEGPDTATFFSSTFVKPVNRFE